MNRIGLATAIAVLISFPLPTVAQDKKPAAKADASAAKPAPAKMEAAPAKPAAAPVEAAPAKPAPMKAEAAPAKPAAAPMDTEAKPAAGKMVADASRKSRSSEDARACLQQASNMEIHRCAHEYR